MTTTYQIYLIADGRTQDREDFQADDEVAAIRIARVLYDACSDVCEAFELWQGRREIRAAQQLHHATARLLPPVLVFRPIHETPQKLGRPRDALDPGLEKRRSVHSSMTERTHRRGWTAPR